MVLKSRPWTRAAVRCALLLAFVAAPPCGCSSTSSATPTIRARIPLPTPTMSSVTLDDALARRRSQRSFADAPLSIETMGKLLWAAQGITDGGGHRTAPSAGALYPLELYVATADGVFHYVAADRALEQLDLPDVRADLSDAALGQETVHAAPMVLVVVGVVARTRAKYGDRAERFVALEAGHATQNVLLEATASGLNVVSVGAFEDDSVREVLGLPSGSTPYYLVCIGGPSP